MTEEKLKSKYQKKYTEQSFLEKLKNHSKKIGGELLHKSLLLYFSAQRKETPTWAKATIYGALGYLIAPIDTIPDLTPFLGYSDDLTIIVAAVATVVSYINEDVKAQADQMFEKIFKEKYQKK